MVMEKILRFGRAGCLHGNLWQGLADSGNTSKMISNLWDYHYGVRIVIGQDGQEHRGQKHGIDE